MLNVKTYEHFLLENLGSVHKEPSSYAAKQAKNLGLEYYGFGKYGKRGTVSHIVVKGSLQKIHGETRLNGEDSEVYAAIAGGEERSKVNAHIQNLKFDKTGKHSNEKLTRELRYLKKHKPERYQKLIARSEAKVKEAEDKIKRMKEVGQAVDASNAEFEKFTQEKTKESHDTHKKVAKYYSWKKLSPTEQGILTAYTGDYYEMINSFIASQTSKVANEKQTRKILFSDDEVYAANTGEAIPVKKAIDIMDEILDSHEAPVDFTVYSGIKGYKKGVMKPGQTYIIPTFRSTTTDFDTTADFRGNTETDEQVIQFDIKRGQKGFYMDGDYTQGDTIGEREFLLPRNTKFRLKGKPRMMHSPQAWNKKGKLITVYTAEIIDDENDK